MEDIKKVVTVSFLALLPAILILVLPPTYGYLSSKLNSQNFEWGGFFGSIIGVIASALIALHVTKETVKPAYKDLELQRRTLLDEHMEKVLPKILKLKNAASKFKFEIGRVSVFKYNGHDKPFGFGPNPNYVLDKPEQEAFKVQDAISRMNGAKSNLYSQLDSLIEDHFVPIELRDILTQMQQAKYMSDYDNRGACFATIENVYTITSLGRSEFYCLQERLKQPVLGTSNLKLTDLLFSIETHCNKIIHIAKRYPNFLERVITGQEMVDDTSAA